MNPGNEMRWRKLGDPEKIMKILDVLISEDVPLQVMLPGEEGKFGSRLLQVQDPCGRDEPGKGGELVVERLAPDKGNTLVLTKPEVRLQFSVEDNLFRCAPGFLGIRNDYPLAGLVLEFPKYVEVRERRRDERYLYEVPEMVSVEIALKDDKDRMNRYELNVWDCSRYGLGVLVRKKDLGVLKDLHPGDLIKDMTFYGLSAKITADAIVRHKTPIRRGKLKGCYVLGIESQEIIENCDPAP